MSPHIDESVRLTHDLPQCWLHRGDCGTVKSTWFSPNVAYEVEFPHPDKTMATRVVLLPDEIEPTDPQPAQSPGPH